MRGLRFSWVQLRFSYVLVRVELGFMSEGSWTFGGEGTTSAVTV